MKVKINCVTVANSSSTNVANSSELVQNDDKKTTVANQP
jgi:hypothetical protein